MDSQNVEYLAALVAEAAGQARIESGIIEMAHAAQELEQHEFMERNETA